MPIEHAHRVLHTFARNVSAARSYASLSAFSRSARLADDGVHGPKKRLIHAHPTHLPFDSANNISYTSNPTRSIVSEIVRDDEQIDICRRPLKRSARGDAESSRLRNYTTKSLPAPTWTCPRTRRRGCWRDLGRFLVAHAAKKQSMSTMTTRGGDEKSSSSTPFASRNALALRAPRLRSGDDCFGKRPRCGGHGGRL